MYVISVDCLMPSRVLLACAPVPVAPGAFWSGSSPNIPSSDSYTARVTGLQLPVSMRSTWIGPSLPWYGLSPNSLSVSKRHSAGRHASHDHSGIPHPTRSAGCGRTAAAAFVADEPPTHLPRGSSISRSPSDRKPQSYSYTGTRTSDVSNGGGSDGKSGPASSSKTRAPRCASRVETIAPAEPAPTTIAS